MVVAHLHDERGACDELVDRRLQRGEIEPSAELRELPVLAGQRLGCAQVDEVDAVAEAGGAVVALLELEAPTQSPFVLRGTIPVPPRTWPRPDAVTLRWLTNSTATATHSPTRRWPT